MRIWVHFDALHNNGAEGIEQAKSQLYKGIQRGGKQVVADSEEERKTEEVGTLSGIF